MSYLKAFCLAVSFFICSLPALAQSPFASHQDTTVRKELAKLPEGVFLNTVYFRAADLLQGCAGITYERYLITKRPMSIVVSYSYSFLPEVLLVYKPDYIVAAGFRYEFMKAGNLGLYVLPEVVYAERSLSYFRSYSSPAAYFSGGAQYRKNRFSLTKSFGVGMAADSYSFAPSVRFQVNLGYAF